MQKTHTGAHAGHTFAPSLVENGTEIYEDLDITLDDIPERPGVTTILKRPGGRIIRHTANAGTPGSANSLFGSGTATDAVASAAQTARKAITEHPVVSTAVIFAIGYLIGRKRR